MNSGLQFPIFTKDIYEQGSGTLGLLVSAVGLGGLLGAVAVAAMGSFERRGLLQLISLLVFGTCLLGFSYTTDRWQGIGLMLLAGFTEQLFLLTNMTMMQLTVPDALRGRVSSIMVLGFGFSPLGALAAGIGSDLVGPQAVTRIMAGSASVLALVLLVAAPSVRNVRLSQMMRLHEEANHSGQETAG